MVEVVQQMVKVIWAFCWRQNFVTKGLSAPGAIYMHENIKFFFIKSDFKVIFLKLATNCQNDKAFLLTSKFWHQGFVCPCPGAIYMYKIIQKYV